jgi:hypothetical protein
MIKFDIESIGIIISFNAIEKPCFAVSVAPLVPIVDYPRIDK